LGAHGSLGSKCVVALSSATDKVRQEFDLVDWSEELILLLTPTLYDLSKCVMNMHLPDTQSHDLFENQVTFTDLLESTVPNSEQRGMQTPSLDFCDWVVAGDQDAKSLADLDLQRSLIDEVEYSQWAKFKIKAEIFVEDYFTDYETLI